MKPGSFDLDTCKEMLGDSVCRRLEDDGRKSAESGRPRTHIQVAHEPALTYADRVFSNMATIVWQAAYDKWRARLERMKK
jgi:hypothetical protein